MNQPFKTQLLKKAFFSIVFILGFLIVEAQIPVNDDACITGANPPINLTALSAHAGTTCGATIDFENIDCSEATDDASVWYTYTPNENDEGYVINFEGTTIGGSVSLEVYWGALDAGCTGFNQAVASSCSDQNVIFQIPNCAASGQIMFVKVTTDDANNKCGEFNISITPSGCDDTTAADACIDATMIIGPTFTPEECGVTPPQFDFSGCLDFACPEDGIDNCTANENPTVWIKVEIDELAAQMITNIEPNGPWEADWAIYSGTCDNLVLVSSFTGPCASSGPVQNHQIAIESAPDGTPATNTYYIVVTAIGYEPGMDGSFTGSVATLINCISCIGFNIDSEGAYTAGCNTTANFEVTQRSTDRPLDDLFFCQGEEVTICIDFFYDASITGVDWLHGMIPNFGSGWDLANFDPQQVANETNTEWADAESECQAYLTEEMPFLCTYTDENGVLQICNTLCDASCPCESPAPTNTPLPSGWFWNQPGGLISCGGECTPSDNYGIGSTTSQIDFCMELVVKTFDTIDQCYQNNDLQFFLQTTSDGVSGCWEDQQAECFLDGAQYSPQYKIDCDILPYIEAEDASLCISGELDVFVYTADGSITDIIVTPVPNNNNISGANAYDFSGGTGFIIDELTNLTNQEQIQLYTLIASDPLKPCEGQSSTLRISIPVAFEAILKTSNDCNTECATLTVDINSCGKPPYQYQWSNGATNDMITVCPTQATSYSVTIEDNFGDMTVLETIVVPEFGLNISISGNSLCEDECTDISPIISGGAGAPYTYEWSTGELAESINVCPILPTTYSITVTDALGCSGVSETEIDVKSPVEIVLPESISVCKDDNFDPFNPDYQVCLDFITGSSPFSVQWTTEIGLVGQPSGFSGECFSINEVASSEFLGAPSGVYTLAVEVTDFFGCTGTTEMEVIITGELTVIAQVNDLQCGETEATITVTGIDAAGNPVTTFLLYGGCPDDGPGTFIDEFFSNAGTILMPPVDLLEYTCYTIIAQTESGCQSSIDVTIQLIEGTPLNISGDEVVCLGSDATISVSNESDFVSFVWTPDIGSTGSLTFTPDSSDIYIVEATDANGCVTQEILSISVLPLDNEYCNDPCEDQQSDYQIVGTAYSDNNENGVYDEDDVPLNNVLVTDLSNNFTTFTNIFGQYVIPVQPGTNYLEANISIGDWVETSVFQNDINVVDSCISDVNFGFIPDTNIPNAQITVTNTIARCDFETKFYVTVENLNQESFSGEVTFTFDDETTFFSSDIPGSQVSGNQLTFNTGIVMPFKQNNYTFKLKMPSGSSSLPILEFDAKLLENAILLDEYEYTEQLRCSYDPNDKRTYPDREGEENLTLIEETLDYTIRFQNNGNDTAFHVRIVDELDINLDPMSIRFNSSSHPLYACIMDHTLIIDFDDILLVDSATNYPASQGYVNFSIDTKDDLPEGTIVNNTADIIFDTNLPIVTNTVLNTVVFDFCTDPVTELPAQICEGEEFLGYTESGTYQDTIVLADGCDSIVIINLTVLPLTDPECIVATNSITKDNIQIYPNPTSNLLNIKSEYKIASLKLYTTTGNNVFQSLNINIRNAEIDLSLYPSGLYLLQVETENGRWIEKVVRR